MSDQSDSQNMSEQPVQMSEGTSPSSSSDEGSRSTPSNLPKAATRQRKKRTSESEDEDYVAEEEATSKRVVLKKEYGSSATIKPGLHKKAPARRVPTSKPRKDAPEGTIKFTMESEEEIGQDKKKKRARTTTARVVGKPSMRKDSSEEEEEEVAAPAPKAPKLMGDAIKSGAMASKPKEAPKTASKAKTTPKRNTRSIPAAEKNKAPVPDTAEEEEGQVQKVEAQDPRPQ